MPAKNDNAVCLTNRSNLFAGKHRSHREIALLLLEPGLPAKDDNAVCLTNRSNLFAGKPRSNGTRTCWSRACPRRTITRFA